MDTIKHKPTVMLSSNPNNYRAISSLASYGRDLINSGIFFIEGYCNTHNTLPDIREVTAFLAKNHVICLLNKKIAVAFLSSATQYISHVVYFDDDNVRHRFDNKYLPSSKYPTVYLPVDTVTINNEDNSMSVDLGKDYCYLFRIDNPNITLPRRAIEYIDGSKYLTADVTVSMQNTTSSCFELTFNYDEQEFEQFNNISLSALEPSAACAVTPITPTVDTNIKYMSIDLGNENFANVIDTVSFKPFVIENLYIYTKFQEYLNNVEEACQDPDVNVRILKVFDQEKQLKRAIKFVVNKTAKHLLEYCRDNHIDTIICGKAGSGYEFSDEQSYKITKFNFSSVLQGYLRYTLRLESEAYDITYEEINEDKTSQYCCRCGTLDKKARNKKRNIFACKSCELLIDGDANASINLLIRYMSEVYKAKDRDFQIDYIYNNINFDNLLQVEKIRIVKKI